MTCYLLALAELGAGAPHGKSVELGASPGAQQGVVQQVAADIERGRIDEAHQALKKEMAAVRTAQEQLGMHDFARVSAKRDNVWPRRSLDPVKSFGPGENPMKLAVEKVTGANGWDRIGDEATWALSHSEDSPLICEAASNCAGCHNEATHCNSCKADGTHPIFFPNRWDYSGTCRGYPSQEGTCYQEVYPHDVSEQQQSLTDQNPIISTKTCNTRVYGTTTVEMDGDAAIPGVSATFVKRFLTASTHTWSQTVCKACDAGVQNCARNCTESRTVDSVEVCFLQGKYFIPEELSVDGASEIGEFHDIDCDDGMIQQMILPHPAATGGEPERGVETGKNAPPLVATPHCCYDGTHAGGKFKFMIPSGHPWFRHADANALLHNFVAYEVAAGAGGAPAAASS
jgi:hypothetical protein